MIPDFDWRMFGLALPLKGKATMKTLLFGNRDLTSQIKIKGKTIKGNSANYKLFDKIFKRQNIKESSVRKLAHSALKQSAAYRKLTDEEKKELSDESKKTWDEDIDLEQSGWVRGISAADRVFKLRGRNNDNLSDALPFFVHTLTSLDALRPRLIDAIVERDQVRIGEVISQTPYSRVLENKKIKNIFSSEIGNPNAANVLTATISPYGIVYLLAAFDAEIAAAKARKQNKNEVESHLAGLFSAFVSKHENPNQWWLHQINPRHDKDDFTWWHNVDADSQNSISTQFSNAKSGKRDISLFLARNLLNSATEEYNNLTEASADDIEDFRFVGRCAYGLMNFTSNLQILSDAQGGKAPKTQARLGINQNFIEEYEKIKSGFKKTPFEAYPDLFDIALAELSKFKQSD